MGFEINIKNKLPKGIPLKDCKAGVYITVDDDEYNPQTIFLVTKDAHCVPLKDLLCGYRNFTNMLFANRLVEPLCGSIAFDGIIS